MATRVLLVIGLLLGFPALAQSVLQPGWIGDARTGCKVWDGDPQPTKTITWSGACSNGLAQGRGVLQWFLNGKPTVRYEGEFRDGKINGQGIKNWTDGGRYEGEFRDGRITGRGVFTLADGSRYEGEFRDGAANGAGNYMQPDGTTYSGTWTNGCFVQGDRWAVVGAAAKKCGFE